MKNLLASWENKTQPFLFQEDRVVSYVELRKSILEKKKRLAEKISETSAFVLEAENSLSAYVKFLTLLEAGHTVLLCPSYQFRDPDYPNFLKEEIGTDFFFCGLNQELHESVGKNTGARHALITEGMKQGKSLFLVRTSGSTGKKYKYILHDSHLFFQKFKKAGSHFFKTLALSPFESIAGIEVLLETITHGCSVVAAGDRLTPAKVSQLICEQKIDYLQTTPTFLNLMVMAKQVKKENLKSLTKIAYGSEPSQPLTLEVIQKELPDVFLKHTYGMSEIGILQTKPCRNEPWRFSLNDVFNPWRIKDGKLEVKSMSTMISYLNYSYLASEEGWFSTGDIATELDGCLHVLGRADDTINVAGRKFFPSELENLILKLDNVADVTVSRQKNDLIGETILAEVCLKIMEEERFFKERFKQYSEKCIPFFMHPHRLVISTEPALNPRLKKARNR